MQGVGRSPAPLPPPLPPTQAAAASFAGHTAASAASWEPFAQCASASELGLPTSVTLQGKKQERDGGLGSGRDGTLVPEALGGGPSDVSGVRPLPATQERGLTGLFFHLLHVCQDALPCFLGSSCEDLFLCPMLDVCRVPPCDEVWSHSPWLTFAAGKSPAEATGSVCCHG